MDTTNKSLYTLFDMTSMCYVAPTPRN